MVTTMDAWEGQSSSNADGPFRGCMNTDETKGQPAMAPRRGNINGQPSRGCSAVATEYLVVSGALDRTLCVYRARFGEGLQMLRRLNVARSPKGMQGVLVVGAPPDGGSEDATGTAIEVHTRNKCCSTPNTGRRKNRRGEDRVVCAGFFNQFSLLPPYVHDNEP